MQGPNCPKCGEVMIRSAGNPRYWVCIEPVGPSLDDDFCDGVAVDCGDCGKAVTFLQCRCANGCYDALCDACYRRHCAMGCRQAHQAAQTAQRQAVAN